MKVLIVEDSVPMLKMIRRTIVCCCEEIYDCDDGAAAIVLYSRQRPDWVLMDIELKQMNGIAATRQIINDFPDAKILMVTNYDDRDLRQAAIEAGARGYVLKDNLLEVRQILQQSCYIGGVSVNPAG